MNIVSIVNSAALIASCCLLLTASSTSSGECPSGQDWYYFNGWCYLVSDDVEGWFGSEKACQKLGGNLATIGNAEENSFLSALGQCFQHFWIGLVKTDVTNRRFSWWNDALFNYTSQFSFNSNAYYDCVYLSSGSNAKWYNTACQTQYRRVCMLPSRGHVAQEEKFNNDGHMKQSGANNNLKRSTKCPEGWLAIEGKCFYVSSKKTNYFNAQITCESMGATVASVKTQREQVQLTVALGCDSKAWIGLEKVKPCISDPSKSFCWMWMDGEDISYSVWASGYPSISNEIECTYTQGRWYTTSCYNEYNFVCVKK